MVYRPIKCLILLCALVPRIACPAIAVWFNEQEPGTEVYKVRMIFDRAYLRIDDGVDESGFILLDRNKKQVYSVNHDDGTIIEIENASIVMKRPEPFVFTSKLLPATQKPVAGNIVKRYQLHVNGKLCAEVAAAAGLLPDAVEALKQFHTFLAGEQAMVAAQMPKRLLQDCSLAENVFLPTAYLEYGFPVFHLSFSGRRRNLDKIDKQFSATPGLFELPVGYRRLRPAKLRSAQ